MTCIIGVEHNGAVILGGDSAVSDGAIVETRREPKVFCVGPYAFGTAGSVRQADILRHSFTPPALPNARLNSFMHTTFIDALRECFRKHGCLQQKGAVESIEGSVLVGIRGRIYAIDSDLQIGRTRHGYTAIGSGAPVAMGAICAAKRMEAQAHDIVTSALEASARHCGDVRRPFRIVTLFSKTE